VANELRDPVVVDFPLRGEGWLAVQTPAARIPSHGTDMLGQRFAYDFLKVDARTRPHDHRSSSARAIVLGRRAQQCYAWGEAVHAPFDGIVVAAVDGVAERRWIHPVRELIRLVRTAWTFTPDKLTAVLGNHVILESAGSPGRYAALVHFAPGTVAVAAGQAVRVGDVLGRVGHTGNSTSPHLHFQLMDSLDFMTAHGIPCAFQRYEVQRAGAWMPVQNGIPNRDERLRSVPST
jgi:hypothetical protein